MSGHSAFALFLAVGMAGCVTPGRHKREVSEAHDAGYLKAFGHLKHVAEKALAKVLEVGDENEALRDVNAQLAAKCSGGELPKPRPCKKGLGQ